MDGSHLSGVSAVCCWEDHLGRPGSAFIPGHMTNGDSHVTPADQLESGLDAAELMHIITLDKVNVKFNVEAASLLPLAIRYSPPFISLSLSRAISFLLIISGVD